ncbi:endo-beta-N-acetylglucosaminidase H [Cutibacterium namnetense]|uniref:endo-beta-N-acetylglucosaminidase H n=1 Tax=Cutibacterium namnetense TaxID=1574624 RepID=UPI0018F79394|nr:endo-beta-N-acetylglucosaminidase H [Cutibacterium namnetense]
MTTAVYIEVNHEDLATVGAFLRAGAHRPVFDLAMIFAANINYDGYTAYLHLNERVMETLRAAETQIRPLQRRGTKVLLSLLGNHEGAGFANFPTRHDAERFAAQVARVVHRYHLDGVDLDDEYSEYGKNDTGQPNEDSFVWFVRALRRHLGPHKLLTLYSIGPSVDRTVSAVGNASDDLDYAWNPWYGIYQEPLVPGMPRSHLGAAAVDWGHTSIEMIETMASRTIRDGYGVFMTYDLRVSTNPSLVQAMTTSLGGRW